MGWGINTMESVGRSKKMVVIFLALVLLIAAIGCGGSGGNNTPKVAVTISPPSVTITPSTTVQFAATVTGASDERVTWTSSGASVSDTGLFTATSATGTYTVTATSVQDPSASATATVTVATTTGVTVVVSPQTLSVAPGGQAQFTATVTGTSNKQVTWTTSAGTISSDGILTAPSTTQTLTVTATSVASPTASAFSRVTVTNTTPLVTITPLGASMGTNETQQFSATVSNASDQSVTWTATGGTIDSSGFFRAGHVSGTYKVTATSVADTNAKAVANITVRPISVTVTPNGANLVAGSSQQFAVQVTGPTNTTVTWSTSRGTISSSGLLTVPASTGPVTVTATSVADPTVSGSATNSVVTASDFVYDFESGVPGVWTPTTSEVTPVGGRHFLGRFADTSAATLTLSGLTNHNSLTVSFDLYVIGGWTGADASSKFSLTATGSSDTFAQTFSNITGDNQTYPDGGSYAPGHMSAEQNSLGYSHNPTILYNDTVYHITKTFTNHTANDVTFTFVANLTGALADQSWGIDNVHVHATP